jgi:hypothetical protein
VFEAKEADSMSPYRKKLFQKVTKQKIGRPVKRLVILFLSFCSVFLILHLLFPLPDAVSYSVIIRDAGGDVVNAYLTPDDKWRMKPAWRKFRRCCAKPLLPKKTNSFTVTRVLIRSPWPVRP